MQGPGLTPVNEKIRALDQECARRTLGGTDMAGNVGMLDRVIRVAIGAGLIWFAWRHPEVPWSSLGWIGVIPIATGLLGTCPLYSILGVSTCAANAGTAHFKN
jgi:Protein of unknown function (DUF2892)